MATQNEDPLARFGLDAIDFRLTLKDISGCSPCCVKHGEPSGLNRIYRLYREECLNVRKRRFFSPGRRSWSRLRPNARWSLDFVLDQFASGRRFRILNIVDDVTWECLAAIPYTSIPGGRGRAN